MKIKSIHLAVAIMCGTASSVTNATPFFMSYASAHAANYLEPNHGYGVNIASEGSQGAQPGILAELYENRFFSGQDADDNPATMQFKYSGTSLATETELKVSVAASLVGAFANEQNPTYVKNSNFEIDPNGVPHDLSVWAYSTFYDTLTIVGASGLHYVSATVDVHGSTVGKFSASGFPVGGVRSSLGGRSVGFFTPMFWSAEGSETEVVHETTISTNQLVVNEGKIDFGLTLSSSIFFNLTLYNNYEMDFESIYTGIADFANTVSIKSFSGFDVNGNPVDLVSVVGSGGHAYLTQRVPSDVPEPGFLILMSAGLLAMSASRRKSGT